MVANMFMHGVSRLGGYHLLEAEGTRNYIIALYANNDSRYDRNGNGQLCLITEVIYENGYCQIQPNPVYSFRVLETSDTWSRDITDINSFANSSR